MIWIIIETLIIVLLAAFYATSIFKNKKEKEKIDNTKMSFKEALDLAGLPVVTFNVGKHKVNFLLDTGSDSSSINMSVLPSLKHRLIVGAGNDSVIGIDGDKI